LESLGKWTATVFLVGGGLSLVAVALSLLGMSPGTSMQGPSSIAAFAAAVLSFVGRLGL